MSGILNRIELNRSVVTKWIPGGRNRFCDLQSYPLLGSERIDIQAVGEFYSSGSFSQFIVPGVEASRLPVAGNIDVGIVWKKEVDFRCEPGSVTSRILPVIARVVGSS